MFYTPDIDHTNELPTEEAAHCARVLRMKERDYITLTDGRGRFFEAVLTLVSPKHCFFRLLHTQEPEPYWNGHLHIAMAPTKNMDRTEWFAEKATEIGFDELSFLNCRFSERKVIKTERIEKILVSAMKQSLKPRKPILNEMIDFRTFVTRPYEGQKFIAHCYADIGDEKPLLRDVLNSDSDVLVMVGPEGDFSREEVMLAIEQGFKSISLGPSRLRTETAALVACHLMNLNHQK